jgi:DNA-binding LacI/PurR family transcriptional regulator
MPASRQPEIPGAGTSLSYKYQRLREHLRQAILSGELAGRLPGERALAKRYQANAKTINKALSDLTLEGLLVRHVGRGTFVASREDVIEDTSIKPRTFGWVTVGPSNQASGQELYLQAAAALHTQGHRLQKLDVQGETADPLSDRALTPGQLRELSGLILFAARPSEQFLANLNRRRVPAVIANNRHDTIRTPAVFADYVHGAFELTQHLIQLGHREVLLVIDAGLLPAARDAKAGHQAAMQRYGLTPREPIWAAGSVDGTDLLRGPNRPTALICVGSKVALWAIQEVAQAGLSVPDDLSVAAIPEPGAPQAGEQQLTAYEVPADRIVDWATKLLLSASPGQPPRIVVVPGQLQIRRSTARATTESMGPIMPPGEAVV